MIIGQTLQMLCQLLMEWKSRSEGHCLTDATTLGATTQSQGPVVVILKYQYDGGVKMLKSNESDDLSL